MLTPLFWGGFKKRREEGGGEGERIEHLKTHGLSKELPKWKHIYDN